MWRVYVPKPVLKSVARFPSRDADRIWAALDAMEREPLAGDVRKLGGTEFRRRVGEYRIRFALDFAEQQVDVLRIERWTSTTWRKR